MKISSTPMPPRPAAAKADFSDGFTTPVEAMVAPIVDQVAGLVAGQQFQGNAHVDVDIDGQKLSYTLRQPTGPRVEVAGEMSGQPFQLEGTLSSEGARIKGVKVPYDVTLGVTPGSIETKGRAGRIDLDETIDIDPFKGQVGVTGKVGGEDLQLVLGAGDDGKTVGEGSLGASKISVIVEQGPNGSILVHEKIGDSVIEEIISAAKG
jgi:hypothetical protein